MRSAAGLRDSRGHPGRPVETEEGSVAASPRRWHQDVDELGHRPPDAVMTHGRQARDHTAAARVQQCGHFLLDDGWRPGRGDVHARQQAAPRPARAETVLQPVPGHPGRQGLLASEHIELVLEDADECVVIKPL